MPSETDLLNVALAKAGCRRINAIDDGSENANHCSTLYPPLLDSSLRLHHWKFATGRAVLAQLIDAPLFEFLYAWGVPSDFIKLQQFYDDLSTYIFSEWDFVYSDALWQTRYRLETYIPVGAPDGTPPVKIFVGNGINAKIEYTRRVTNPDLWDGAFFQYLACKLGSDLARAIPKDGKRAVELLQESDYWLGLAAAVDGQEKSIEPMVSDSLLWGRRS